MPSHLDLSHQLVAVNLTTNPPEVHCKKKAFRAHEDEGGDIRSQEGDYCFFYPDTSEKSLFDRIKDCLGCKPSDQYAITLFGDVSDPNFETLINDWITKIHTAHPTAPITIIGVYTPESADHTLEKQTVIDRLHHLWKDREVKAFAVKKTGITDKEIKTYLNQSLQTFRDAINADKIEKDTIRSFLRRADREDFIVAPEYLKNRPEKDKRIQEILVQYECHLYQKLIDQKVISNESEEDINALNRDKLTPKQKKLLTRYETIHNIKNDIKDKSSLNIEDLSALRQAVVTCQQNKPEWLERPFLQILTDLLTLGLKPLYRFFYSKERKFEQELQKCLPPKATMAN